MQRMRCRFQEAIHHQRLCLPLLMPTGDGASYIKHFLGVAGWKTHERVTHSLHENHSQRKERAATLKLPALSLLARHTWELLLSLSQHLSLTRGYCSLHCRFSFIQLLLKMQTSFCTGSYLYVSIMGITLCSRRFPQVFLCGSQPFSVFPSLSSTKTPFDTFIAGCKLPVSHFFPL